MTGPRIGSLASGYGGLDMAVLEVFGGSIAWHLEFDPAPSKILAHHWPEVPNHGDITTTDWTTVEPVDVLIGGYPCQPFSHAGKRRGTDDHRHIWPWIADAIRVLRPRLCVFENVAGHLGLGFDAVLADLAALGMDVRWGLVRASEAVGAPHRRERLFIVAADTLNHERGPEWPVPRLGRGPAPRTDLPHVPDSRFGTYGPAVTRWATILGRPIPDPVEDGRLSARFVEFLMGLPDGHVTDPAIGISRSRQLKALSNGVIPQQAAAALRAIVGGTLEALPGVPGDLLPTPAVNDMGEGKTPADWDQWTDRMKAAHGNGNGHGKSLAIEALRLGEA